MNELELQLRELGGAVAYPATPDLASVVRRQLAERRRPWWPVLPRRQAIAIALAVLAVSIAAVMAVPSARTAVLRFFRIGAATVERVETLPPARQRPLNTGLGRAVPLRDASRLAGFRLLLPSDAELPRRVYVRERVQSVLLDVPDAGAVLLIEIRGRDQFGFSKKFADSGTGFDEVSVNGEFGLWIRGAPHVVMFHTRSGRVEEFTTRLAGNVLVWTRGDLTLRLEGDLTKEQALELARSITEPAGS